MLLPVNLDMPCCACGVSTHAINEYFMLRNAIWKLVRLPLEARTNFRTRWLCVGCLEQRLKRQLNSSDFIECPLNASDDVFPKSLRLRNRLFGEHEPMSTTMNLSGQLYCRENRTTDFQAELLTLATKFDVPFVDPNPMVDVLDKTTAFNLSHDVEQIAHDTAANFVEELVETCSRYGDEGLAASIIGVEIGTEPMVTYLAGNKFEIGHHQTDLLATEAQKLSERLDNLNRFWGDCHRELKHVNNMVVESESLLQFNREVHTPDPVGEEE